MKNKKGDLTIAKIVIVAILLVLLVWVIFWYIGLRGGMVSVVDSISGNLFG